MKKSKKLAILSLCLSPLMLLTACVAPPSYTITASSSDISLGYTHGFNKEAVQEGKKVTLSAVSISEENPFVCWVKDDKTVVSNENKITLVYNQKNAGHYTAVFNETDFSKMSYACLSEFNFEIGGYKKLNYEIETALLTSGSSDYYEFSKGEYLTFGNVSELEPESVLYFGSAGSNFVYLLKINITLTDASEATTNYQYQLTTKIDKSFFDESGEFAFEEEITEINANLSLKFNKLNTQLFPEEKEEEKK